MYSKEEFDKEKTKVLKYILYKKRSEYEIRNKFSKSIEENLLDDIIEYLKEAKYIDDGQYIEKTINNFMILKNLSIKEIQYKLISKGLNKNLIEDYIYNENEELNNYEIKSAKNIIYKKSNTMELEDIKVYSYYFDVITISDGRLPEELDMIKNAFDKVYRLRVERPSFKSSLNKEELKHKTETALDNYTNYEYTIINDGSLEDLNNKVKQIVDEVI